MQDSLRRKLFMHHYPYCRIVAHGALTQNWGTACKGNGAEWRAGGQRIQGTASPVLYSAAPSHVLHNRVTGGRKRILSRSSR